MASQLGSAWTFIEINRILELYIFTFNYQETYISIFRWLSEIFHSVRHYKLTTLIAEANTLSLNSQCERVALELYWWCWEPPRWKPAVDTINDSRGGGTPPWDRLWYFLEKIVISAMHKTTLFNAIVFLFFVIITHSGLHFNCLTHHGTLLTCLITRFTHLLSC
jgi:hypothetical protein